jgi:dTDP-4-amino-4,6-dideoxygalactose transaminase
MKVPFFDYPRLYSDDKHNIIKIVDDVCGRGAFIMQSDLDKFELELASYTSSNFAVGVANATDGLELCWMAVGLSPGDEVIVSSHTMLATASSIKVAGGTPVPIDIGYDGLMDPDKIEAAITSKTVGIMPTQLNGRTCDMDKIMSLANYHKLTVVEDAAQALGSSFKGKHAGTFGVGGAISFFPAKVLGCLGDGGAVLCQDSEFFDKIYQLHDHGRDKNGVVKSWGRNSRLDNLNAAILSYKLKIYSLVVERRRQIAQLYHDRLCSLKELSLPPSPNADPRHFDVYQNYEIMAERRDELRIFLRDASIGTLVQWGGKAIHQWDILGFTATLPETDNFFRKCIMLPMNIFVSDEDVNYVCDQINLFYG